MEIVYKKEGFFMGLLCLYSLIFQQLALRLYLVSPPVIEAYVQYMSFLKVIF